MGDFLHRAILVTDYYHEDDDSLLIVKAHKKASDPRLFGCMVSPIVPGYANGWATFMVVPNGLKNGGGARIVEMEKAFVGWLRQQVDSRGYPEMEWVWVQYGDEVNNRSVVLDSSDIQVQQRGKKKRWGLL